MMLQRFYTPERNNIVMLGQGRLQVQGTCITRSPGWAWVGRRGLTIGGTLSPCQTLRCAQPDSVRSLRLMRSGRPQGPGSAITHPGRPQGSPLPYDGSAF